MCFCCIYSEYLYIYIIYILHAQYYILQYLVGTRQRCGRGERKEDIRTIWSQNIRLWWERGGNIRMKRRKGAIPNLSPVAIGKRLHGILIQTRGVCPRATALSGEPPQEIRERKNEWLKNYILLSFLFSQFSHVLVCVRT